MVLGYDVLNQERVKNRKIEALKSEVSSLHHDIQNKSLDFIKASSAKFDIWRVNREDFEWWRNGLLIVAGLLGAS